MQDQDADRPLDKAAQEREETERHVADEPHSVLNLPASEPDPTEWPDPFDHRADPREAALAEDGELRPAGQDAQSTSSPHPKQDPEAIPVEGPKREKLDQ
jgi:hypothetical protein